MHSPHGVIQGYNGLALADTNYFSEANCKYVWEHKIDGYIPDAGFRKRDPRFPYKKEESRKKNKYRQEDFKYQSIGNYFICPQGKRLTLEHRNASHHGYRGARYQAKAKDCGTCVKQYKCLRGEAKQRNLFIIKEKKNQTYSAKIRKKFDCLSDRDIYAARRGIVEPVFANIVYHKKMNRFNYRGRAKVRLQWIFQPGS